MAIEYGWLWTAAPLRIPAADLLSIEPEDTFPAQQYSAVDPVERYGDLIRKAAAENGMNEQLIRHVVEAESNFDPKAVSPKERPWPNAVAAGDGDAICSREYF